MRAEKRARDDDERELLVMGETGETLVCAIPWPQEGKMDAHTILVLACSEHDFDMRTMALFNVRGEMFVPGDIVDDPTEVLHLRSLKGVPAEDRYALPLVGRSGAPAGFRDLPVPPPASHSTAAKPTGGIARSFARERDPLGHVLVDCGSSTLRVPVYDVDMECNRDYVLAYLHHVFGVDITGAITPANPRAPVGLFKTYRLDALLLAEGDK